MDSSKSFACVIFVTLFLTELITFVKGCGETLTSQSGEIISEGYPSMYPNNYSCQWYILAPSDQVIEITFLDIDLEVPDNSDKCLDTVSIYDGNVNDKLLTKPFCEDGPGWPRFPTRMLSTSNHMTIVMETNGAGTGKGIVANYKHVSPRIETIAAVDTDNLQIFHFNRMSHTSPGKIPLTGASYPYALSFDPIEGNFYFTDIGERPFIGRVNFRGSRIDVLIDDGLQEPMGIAAGYLSGLLFWTDANRSEVSVSRLDGLFRKTLVPANTGCVSPKAILLDPNQENVYWTCLGQIETSKADGSDRTVFTNNSVVDPRSLALDSETMTLFWTDAGTLTLQALKLDGSNGRRIFTASVFSDLSGFTMDSHAYFWANPVGKRLQLVKKTITSGTFYNVMQNPLSSIEGIYYYNSAAEIQAPNECRLSNGGCEELCFPNGCQEVTPEIVDCPENVFVLTEIPKAVDWIEPSAKSRSSGKSLQLSIGSRSHKPNDKFPLGTTTVTYSFSDDNGNSNECSFKVTLRSESFTTRTPMTLSFSTHRGRRAPSLMIVSFTGVSLLILLLITGLFIWYRNTHMTDGNIDEEVQEGYMTEVDSHLYNTIPDILENNPSIQNVGYMTRVDRSVSCITNSSVQEYENSVHSKGFGRGNGKKFETYAKRLHHNISSTISNTTLIDDPSSRDGQIGGRHSCLGGYTTRIVHHVSRDSASMKSLNNSLHNGNKDNDERCLEETRKDHPTSCYTISNNQLNDHEFTTQVEPETTKGEVDPEATYKYIGEQLFTPELLHD